MSFVLSITSQTGSTAYDMPIRHGKHLIGGLCHAFAVDNKQFGLHKQEQLTSGNATTDKSQMGCTDCSTSAKITLVNMIITILLCTLTYFEDSPDRVSIPPIPEDTDDEYYLDMLCLDPGPGWRGLELAHPRHIAWDMGSLDVRQWYTRISLAADAHGSGWGAGADVARDWRIDQWSKDADKTDLYVGKEVTSGLWSLLIAQPEFQKRYAEIGLALEYKNTPFTGRIGWSRPGFDNNYSFRLSSQNEGYEEMYRRAPYIFYGDFKYCGFDNRLHIYFHERSLYVKDFIDFENKYNNLQATWREEAAGFWASWGNVEFPHSWVWCGYTDAGGGEKPLEKVARQIVDTKLVSWDAGSGLAWGRDFRLALTAYYRGESRQGKSDGNLHRWDGVGMARVSWQMYPDMRFETGLAAGSINIRSIEKDERWWENRAPIALEWKLFEGCRLRMFSGIDLNRKDWAELLFYDKAGANLLCEL